MASLTCSPVGRRLHELLEQPQEPFLMEAYLVENGCSGRIIRPPHPSSPFCWPLNAAGKKLRKFGSHGGGIRRSRAASFLRRVLVELVYSKSLRKLLLLDSTTTNAKNRSSTIFDSLSLDSKDQLSPVSVLRLHHSDQTSLFDKQNEWPLPRESSITLKETQEGKSVSRNNKAKFSDRRRVVVLDCLWEAEEESVWSFHGCLGSDMLEQAMESEKGERLKAEAGELGLFLEAAILDDLKEETILHMLTYNSHYKQLS